MLTGSNLDNMKILLAYDGSESADLAIEDLQQAGLPDHSEALIVVVAEVWLTPPPALTSETVKLQPEEQAEIEAQEKLDLCEPESPMVSDSEQLAAHAAAMVKQRFPSWQVQTLVRCGSPAGELLQVADHSESDLIVVGSRGRTTLGRLILGSVSQKLVSEARCSVRVGRGRTQESTRVQLVIGVDGSRGADLAVHAVANRQWPPETQVRLVTSTAPFSEYWPSITVTAENLQSMQQRAEAQLVSAGLKVSTLIDKVEPKTLLVNEAETLGADCIFLGARGQTFLDRILLGSVSTAVSVRAPCSVEVVRGA